MDFKPRNKYKNTRYTLKKLLIQAVDLRNKFKEAKESKKERIWKRYLLRRKVKSSQGC